MNHLAEGLMGNPEHRDLEDSRMAKYGVLNFSGVDVFAPGNDHVLGPVDDEQVALFVRPGHVAALVPTITGEGTGGLFRPLPIAEHDVRSPHVCLANLARLANRTVKTADLDFDADDRLSAAGKAAPCRFNPASAVAVVRTLRRSYQRRRLGHAIELDDVARQQTADPKQQFYRHR